MSSLPRTSAILVVLVVLAGCQGIAPRGGETPTLTPVAVPTEVPTERPPRTLAPGVTESGVSDPSALAAAHAAALTDTSVTFHANYTERASDGTVLERTATTVRFGTGDRYHYVSIDADRSEAVRRVERWSDGERVLERRSTRNGTAYRVVRGADGEPLPPVVALPVGRAESGGIERVFRAVETTVVGREVRNGTTHYRVVSTGMTTPNPTAVRNASLVALVDERGVVHRYRLAYTIDRGDDAGAVRVVGMVRFTALGTTTVERPAWADRVEKE